MHSRTVCSLSSRKWHSQDLDSMCLLPGLPNDLAVQVIARIPLSSRQALKLHNVSEQWECLFAGKDLQKAREDLQVTEDVVFVVGKSSGRQQILSLNPKNSLWHSLGPLPHKTLVATQHGCLEDNPLHGFEFTGVGDKLVLLGGFQKLSAHSQATQGVSTGASSGPVVAPGGVWILSSTNGEWTRGTDMVACSSRSHFACGVLGEFIFAAGGLCCHSGLKVNSMECYSLETDSWRILSPIPDSHLFQNFNGRCTGVVVNGEFYVFGVCPTGGGLVALLGVYKPETDSWRTPHDAPCPRPITSLDPQSWSAGGGGVLSIQAVAVGETVFFMRGLLDDFHGWGDRELRRYTVGGHCGGEDNVWEVETVVPGPSKKLDRDWPVHRQAFGLASANGSVLVVGGEAWTRLFGRLDVKSVQRYVPGSNGGSEEGRWSAVGAYEDEGFLQAVWKCTTLKL